MKKALTAFGPIFVQLYGQGEAPMTITGLRRADHLGADDATLGSVGYARSGVDVAVVDAGGGRGASVRSVKSSAAVTSSCPVTGTIPTPRRPR